MEPAPTHRPRHRLSTRVRGLAIVASLVALAGCGGGGDVAAPTTSTSVGASSSTTTEPEPVVEPAGSFAGASGVVIAHRGASASAPEHTFAAYDLALAQGADYLEQDLQLTADGVAVVLHDSTLDRTVRGPATTCSGPVSERTAAELRSCDAGSWFNERWPDRAQETYVGQPIPTLAEVFDRYGGEVRYYIEIKSPNEQPGLEEALLTLLDETDFDAGDGTLPPVVIQSFIGDSLRRIHALRPDLPLVQLVATGVVLDDGALDRVAEYAVAIAPNKANVDAEVVAAANARCLDVHPWTVDDPGAMAQFLGDGAGGMFTNRPDRLVEAVEDHGVRPAGCEPQAARTGS